MTTKQLNRRLFLQGFGGAVLAAPFLGSLVQRTASAQAADAPRRIITLFSHYGCLTNRWFPAVSHGPLAAADYEKTTLKHLAPFADKLLMPRGIRAMNEWSFNQDNGQQTDPHTQVMNAFYTAAPSNGWSGSMFGSVPGLRSGIPDKKFDARPVGGRSLDHIIAEQISPGKTPLVMAIGGSQPGEMTNFSFSSVGTMEKDAEMFAANGNPTTIFNEIAKTFMDGGAPTEASYAVSRGKSVLDLVKDDLDRLNAANMSASDHRKLDAWAQLLTETTTAVRGSQCNDAGATKLGLSSDGVQGGATNDLQKATPIMLNLAVLSALCDTNRSIFMKFPGTYTFSFLDGIMGDSHGISHRVGGPGMGGNCVSGVNEMIATIDDWYAQQFAFLVKQLDSVEEGDGTLLDNCAAIWFQELSDGNAHNLNNLPIIQAGSCGGYFKTGQAVNVEDGATDLTWGNSEGACSDGKTSIGMGEVQSATRTPADVAGAPINKYFCNLMNALGVKAGADGFAAIDGTEEVVNFGYYDNTKDFATFLTNSPAPASINDPGAFEDLKA